MKRNHTTQKNRRRNTKDLDSIQKIRQLPNTSRNNYTNLSYMNDSYDRPSYSYQNLRTVPSSRRQSSATVHAPTRSKKTKKVRKKRFTFISGRLFFFVVFIAGTIYLAQMIIDTMQKPVISYQMVQRGLIDNSEELLGLIVRNETVVKSEASGSMYVVAVEGDKVKKDGQVYQILDPSTTSVIQEDIQKVESDIERIQHKRQDISYYQNEIQQVNNNIDVHIEGFYRSYQIGQMNSTHSLKKEIENEIIKRKNIHMKENVGTLRTLQSQKQNLSTELRANQKIYTTPYAGIVSYSIDGYEEQFTYENIEKITEKDIQQKYASKNTTISDVIQTNEPAYKIIQGDQWYIICFMPEASAQKFKEKQKYTFVLSEDNNTELSFIVEQKISEGKQHKVIFSSREQLELFLGKRIISFRSTQYTYEGLKIPISAITERNLMKVPSSYIVEGTGGKGVLKKIGDSGESIFIGLNIQYEDDQGYAYVIQNFGDKEVLQLGDYLIHPSEKENTYNVSQIATTKGVYAVNGRIAKFKQIDIMAQNDEYAIVQSNSIYGLKQFDQIITNPKNIHEEQLLKDMDVQNNKN